jgi:hypothetical protein
MNFHKKINCRVSFNGEQYDSLEISPVAYHASEPEGPCYEQLHEVSGEDDPSIFCWGVYGWKKDGLAEHLADMPTLKSAEAFAELLLESSTAEARRETAMCLWEACLEFGDGIPAVAALKKTIGTAHLRQQFAGAVIVNACDNSWQMFSEEGLFDAPFDWEYCPMFVQECLAVKDDAVCLVDDWMDRLRRRILVEQAA